MAIVNYPVLDFKNSLAAFHNFAAEYNKDKPLREQLRPQHSKIYARILTLLSRHLYERNKLFNDTPEFRQLEDDKPVMLATNRKAMSWVENTLQVNGNTVYRQVLRLINAGVIMEKINHGSRMNFELLISPEFLLISDLINPDYKPDSKYLQNENKAKQPSLNTSFTPEYLTLEKELFNNSNITVDKESLPAVRDEIVKEPERTEKKNLLKEHGEISQNPDERQSKIDEKSTKLFHEWNQSKSGHSEKGQKLAPEQESKLREHQKGAARWFFWYVLSRLFEERIFNPAHLENTLAYVEQYYFTNCHSLKTIENTKRLYKWRIDKARRSIERNKTDMQWIFPGHYLDINRKDINHKTGKSYMSFVNTATWSKKFEHLQKQKQAEKQKTTDLDLLNKQFRIYLNNPNLNQFRRCEAFVKKNIPHLTEDFLSQFTSTKIQTHA